MTEERHPDLRDEIDGSERRRYLDARRATSRERYDTLHAPGYDGGWGGIDPTHARFVDQLLALTRPGGTVLDAACGTGKYWPLVLESGRTVVGVDQSAGMLEQARRKHPEVPQARIGLQELPFDALFDAVMCIDALENVGPEDWPVVLRGLAIAARSGASLYVTVELTHPDELRKANEAARVAGRPVVEGELDDGVGYHYYPSRARVLRWLRDAGLTIRDEAEADDYWHLLLDRASS